VRSIHAARTNPAADLDFRIVRAMVVSVDPDGRVTVDCHAVLSLDVLLAGSRHPTLVPGDEVLVWLGADDASGVILGRIGRMNGVDPAATEAETRPAVGGTDTPAALMLEATDELTLRVGDGSITIRKDGRILIRGTDLVSHARRLNRIKGGAVSIN
jgi:hypothetical protein